MAILPTPPKSTNKGDRIYMTLPSTCRRQEKEEKRRRQTSQATRLLSQKLKTPQRKNLERVEVLHEAEGQHREKAQQAEVYGPLLEDVRQKGGGLGQRGEQVPGERHVEDAAPERQERHRHFDHLRMGGKHTHRHTHASIRVHGGSTCRADIYLAQTLEGGKKHQTTGRGGGGGGLCSTVVDPFARLLASPR